MIQIVKKKPSALELSQASHTRTSRLQALTDPATLLFVVGCMALGAALICFWQSSMMIRELSGTHDIERYTTTELETLAKFVAETRQRIAGAVNNDAVTRPLAAGGDGAIDTARAALKQLLPDLVSADFYKADLSDVLSGDLAKFGYAKAAMLVRSHELNLGAPLQSHMRADKQRVLAFAVPALRSREAVAFVYVELPFEPLLTIFSVYLFRSAGERRDGRSRSGAAETTD